MNEHIPRTTMLCLQCVITAFVVCLTLSIDAANTLTTGGE